MILNLTHPFHLQKKWKNYRRHENSLLTPVLTSLMQTLPLSFSLAFLSLGLLSSALSVHHKLSLPSTWGLSKCIFLMKKPTSMDHLPFLTSLHPNHSHVTSACIASTLVILLTFAGNC